MSCRVLTLATVLLFVFVHFAVSETAEAESPEDRNARMQWWRDAKFGMFVHWGLYSGLAGTWEDKPIARSGNMEWIQHKAQAQSPIYAEKALPLFRPKEQFAQQWARVAKEAGCEYLVFTTKHHEGFSLHDSQVSEFDAGSMLNRDLVAEIVAACRAEGLKVGFYYSLIDWHHNQYAYARSRQLPHPLHGTPYPNGQRDHNEYIQFLHAQVGELMSNYGPVDILWWDYSSQDFQGDEAWKAFELMELVRDKQPSIIMNNRLFRIPEAGWKSMGTDGFTLQLDARYGDFITPEQHIPSTGVEGLDWETCMTMNSTWGYSKYDTNWKSDKELIRHLIDIVSKGGNFLLNIGPQGDGTVPHESVTLSKTIGKWMETNGVSIRATSASPIDAPKWGRCTRTKDKLYLHVFDWPENSRLVVPIPRKTAGRAYLLSDHAKASLRFGQKSDQLTIDLPAKCPDPIATVVAVELKKSK